MQSKRSWNVLAVSFALLLANLMPGVYAAEKANDEARFIEILSGYLDVSERYITLAARKEAAVYFAVEGIVEIYEARQELANAVPHLRNILNQYPDNRTVHNIVRFKLREIYNETGRSDLALNELELVIQENRE